MIKIPQLLMSLIATGHHHYEFTIIAHGDGDGTIAAACLRRAMVGVTGRLMVTQPFLLHKLSDLTGPTVVIDIAVDNKNPAATLEWARRNAERIVLWVDHHEGGEALAKILGDCFFYDPKAPSCPQVMADYGLSVPADWLAAANACDRPTDFAATALSDRYNAAFKVALVALQNGDRKAVEAVQAAFIDELVSGKLSGLVSEYAGKYPALSAATDEAVERLDTLVPGIVGHVDIPAGQGSVDVTQVMVRGYKKFATIVITTVSADDGSPIAVVGTSRKPDELNLVERFNLGSGNPSRIVLTGDKNNLTTIGEVLK